MCIRPPGMVVQARSAAAGAGIRHPQALTTTRIRKWQQRTRRQAQADRQGPSGAALDGAEAVRGLCLRRYSTMSFPVMLGIGWIEHWNTYSPASSGSYV